MAPQGWGKGTYTLHFEPCDVYCVFFPWSQIVLRVNCLSTEFSSQKGVKGYTLHFVSDTYDDMTFENTEPVHRAFCQVKIFRDKVCAGSEGGGREGGGDPLLALEGDTGQAIAAPRCWSIFSE